MKSKESSKEESPPTRCKSENPLESDQKNPLALTNPPAIHDRDRVIQQRLHTIDEYFPPLPAGTADR
jgi:hypothetical protein